MIQRIATVAVYVEDQARALEFWPDREGFEVRRRESMGSSGDSLELAPESAGSRIVIHPRALTSRWQELKPSIVFEFEDIHAAWMALKDKGVEFTEDPKKMA